MRLSVDSVTRKYFPLLAKLKYLQGLKLNSVQPLVNNASKHMSTIVLCTLHSTFVGQILTMAPSVSLFLCNNNNNWFTGSTISSETLYFVDWESADVKSKNILGSNERYIQKLQNDTNIALVL